jgi:UDP-N-acetylmuramoylalanine-D-glutamate ligase
MWTVDVEYIDRKDKRFHHLDMHHSVKQYAAIAQDMRSADTVHGRAIVKDDDGRVYRDTLTDPLVPGVHS